MKVGGTGCSIAAAAGSCHWRYLYRLHGMHPGSFLTSQQSSSPIEGRRAHYRQLAAVATAQSAAIIGATIAFSVVQFSVGSPCSGNLPDAKFVAAILRCFRS